MDSIGEMSVFVEVVQTGSFVGAARRLGLTASGVSRKISRFEDRLGVRLFNRTTRTLSLTEAGDALFERCTDILLSIEAAEDVVRDLSANPKGTLRVAASNALAVEVLVPFFQDFGRKFEDLSLTVVQGDGTVDLLTERVDLALAFKRPTETSFIARKLIADPWVVCAAPRYLDEHGTPSAPEDLLDHRCLTIHARGVTTDDWGFEVDGALQTYKIDSVFSGIGLTVKAAAVQGLGVARLANFLVQAEIARGDLVPLLTEFAPEDDRAIHAVYPNRQYLPSKVRIFIDDLKAYLAGTSGSKSSR